MTALYRFYAANGRLLYIGITMEPASRFRGHRGDKPWWDEVTAITIERLPDRLAALRAERLAIRTERPQYNKTHTQSPSLQSTGAWHAGWNDRKRWLPPNLGKERRPIYQDAYLCGYNGEQLIEGHRYGCGTAGHCYTCEREWPALASLIQAQRNWDPWE